MKFLTSTPSTTTLSKSGMKFSAFLCLLLVGGLLFSCTDSDEKEEGTKAAQKTQTISTDFNEGKFDTELKLELLNEINICQDTLNPDPRKKGMSFCSPENFAFYNYSEKISLENGFMLQVKAGVNQFPFRRLLFFVRENGRLVTMNNIIGYLVEKRSSNSGFDDLVVSLTENLEGKYMRYDILLKYKEGKYHFEEVLGDLYGEITDSEMKKAAKEDIEKRIRIKQLMF